MPQESNAAYEAVADELVAAGATRTKMFGMPSLKVGGKAFAGFSQGALIVKLRGEAHAQALALPGAMLFDPMGGRPMKEWVVIPLEHAGRWAEFGHLALAGMTAAH
jgi:hypothetical protein